jgi:V8-like Glu-specific endopeptidase
MAALVDTFPFPFYLPEAQELHATLADIYPTSTGALYAAARAGLNPAMLFGGQPAFYLWRDILQESSNASLTRTLVQIVRDQNPNNPRRSFLDALLTATPTATDRQPRDANGAPMFIKANDEVTEPEALLFKDDLTLGIGRLPWLIAVLQRLIAIGPSICRLDVEWATARQRGTGFRIASDLLLTNWHVLHNNGSAASSVNAEFGYDDDGKGGGLASTSVACDVGSIRGDAGDDWAIVRVTAPLGGGIPILKLSEATAPVNTAPAFIVQHPDGERKRVAYVRNQITDFDDRVVHYLSDTQPGSSGSPVLDDNGKLVALHHAGGRPQEVAGKPPLRKNEGIRIPRIVAGLAQMKVAVP